MHIYIYIYYIYIKVDCCWRRVNLNWEAKGARIRAERFHKTGQPNGSRNLLLVLQCGPGWPFSVFVPCCIVMCHRIIKCESVMFNRPRAFYVTPCSPLDRHRHKITHCVSLDSACTERMSSQPQRQATTHRAVEYVNIYIYIYMYYVYIYLYRER